MIDYDEELRLYGTYASKRWSNAEQNSRGIPTKPQYVEYACALRKNLARSLQVHVPPAAEPSNMYIWSVYVTGVIPCVTEIPGVAAVKYVRHRFPKIYSVDLRPG